MKYLLLCAAPFVLLLLLGNGFKHELMNDSLPPFRYQGNTAAVVLTVDNPDAVCGSAPKGYIVLGCEFEKKGTPYVVMPNACRAPEVANENSYAHLMCHEFGHVNGWNTDHDN